MKTENGERCKLTDMLVDQCGCLQHRGKPPIVPPKVSRLFILARDNSDGCACGSELREGDEAAYIDDELSCLDCVRKVRGEETSKFTKKWRK